MEELTSDFVAAVLKASVFGVRKLVALLSLIWQLLGQGPNFHQNDLGCGQDVQTGVMYQLRNYSLVR